MPTIMHDCLNTLRITTAVAGQLPPRRESVPGAGWNFLQASPLRILGAPIQQRSWKQQTE